jgi:hypothetical protein
MIFSMTRKGLAAAACALFLAGCSLSEQDKSDLLSVQNSGVSSATYDKMLHGDELSLSDICGLERAHVDEGVILRYLRQRGTVYMLSSSDIARLEKAGASRSLIDYMEHTAVNAAVSYPTVQVYTYAPYGPIGYYGPSASSYWGPQYYGAYDPFYGPPY